MSQSYEEKYRQEAYYWGKKPSASCFEVLKIMPPDRPLKLIDIGCGEGRNAVFFARNGYHVTAFDRAQTGVQKTRLMAEEAGVTLTAFQADINTYRLSEDFDIVFSTGTLHYILPELRGEIFENYKQRTSPGGLNVLNVFVHKPFIPQAPDGEGPAHHWLSGELMTFYHDWKLEFCSEEIFDCMSSGVRHQHAVNRIIARKMGGLV